MLFPTFCCFQTPIRALQIHVYTVVNVCWRALFMVICANVQWNGEGTTARVSPKSILLRIWLLYTALVRYPKARPTQNWGAEGAMSPLPTFLLSILFAENLIKVI